MSNPEPPAPAAPPTRSPDASPGGTAALTLPQAIQRAIAACQRSDWAEAERVCHRILAAVPGSFDALHLLGMIAVQTRRLPEAADFLARAVEANPRSAQARMTLGGTLRELGRRAEALECFEGAIGIEPGSAPAHVNRGIVLNELGRGGEALASLDRAVALAPQSLEAHYNRGLALQGMGRHADALASYERAIALQPGLAGAHNNRGVVLRELGRLAEALASHERALALDARSAEAHNNRGVVLRELRRHAEALQCYEAALALRPAWAQAWFNRGSALADAGRHAEALHCQERAIAIDPGFVEAHVRRGVALRDLGRHGEALASLDRAAALDPGFEWLQGLWLHSRMRVCEWSGLAEHVDHLVAAILRGERVAHPFPVLALTGSEAVHRRAAQTWVEAKLRPRGTLPPIPARAGGGRIRIGYFSADFFEHATSYLLAEVLEGHDRGAFEVTAFSFGPDTRDAMRSRIGAAVERFVDVRERSDEEIAQLARSLAIDVAVDLKGFTEDCRTGIFALRAAPVQASYLGYPGTMGADFIDYLVADETVVPREHGRHYAERIAWLPGSYQANDARRRISERAFTRAEAGLPAAGFVFCCFNNSYKILPATFDAWMRLLARVEGSVLWLLHDNDQAASNLRREAGRRGVAPGRLVFAPRIPLADHLARHRLADLFLDTLPYNAHTTASDALWAGLPVLTLAGESFAGRVAASLLHAVGLPELVARTAGEYEAMAFELASDPARLAQLRQRLQEGRSAAPLFDAPRFARHLESAFRLMHERHLAGLAPESFRVPG
jgi:predicted O-linked N-acetylglucosamine transferase (SPINDLY family)